jgi:hypothetical protein
MTGLIRGHQEEAGNSAITVVSRLRDDRWLTATRNSPEELF